MRTAQYSWFPAAGDSARGCMHSCSLGARAPSAPTALERNRAAHPSDDMGNTDVKNTDIKKTDRCKICTGQRASGCAVRAEVAERRRKR